MSLINPAILFGLGLTAIPVALHLLMRSKPKKLIFPALRLIEQRRRTNTQRLRLRHLWLLLLRIAVIGAIVLAIARPSLPPANYGLNTRELIALAFVIALAIGGYYGAVHYARKQQLPKHQLSWRRSLFRTIAIAGGILLGLLQVAWPYSQRIRGEMQDPRTDVADNLPVAAILIFDASPGMEYLHGGKTRLDQAREIAQRHLQSLPLGSRIAVADTSSTDSIVYQADRMSADSRLDALRIGPVSIPVNDRLQDAMDLQDDDRQRTISDHAGGTDRFVREIYIFTDLTVSAWRLEAADQLQQRLQELDWLQVYVIDVGVEAPIDHGLVGLKLSTQSVASTGQLTVEAAVTSTLIDNAGIAVEAFVRNAQDQPVKQDHRTIDVAAGGRSIVQFPINGLTAPYTQGELRLVSSDPLASNDVLYFTVGVHAPPGVLVVGETWDESQYFYEALGLDGLVQEDRARYRRVFRDARRFDVGDLSQFAALCLINVRRLDDATWTAIADFVRTGGGLAVVLGSDLTEAEQASWNSDAAQAVLPAELLGRVTFFSEPAFLDIVDPTHPLYDAINDSPGGMAELTTFVRFDRRWSVRPLDTSFVSAEYRHQQTSPAIVDRLVGKGRSVMLTSAMDYLADGGSRWNNFVQSWTYLTFIDRLAALLTGEADAWFNFTSGDEVVIARTPTVAAERYLLREPGLTQLPGEVERQATSIIIREAYQPGHYQIIPTETSGSAETGFSVNLLDEESDFTRLTVPQLDNLLGENRYNLARDPDELERFVHLGRMGVEVYPLLILVVIVFFCSEHFVANWFYDTDGTRGQEQT